MKALFVIIGLAVMSPAFADDVFRIEVGKDYRGYSDSDLKRRVWELERAVGQLQARIYHLEAAPVKAAPDEWVCTLKAMGNNYTGTGPSKALAMNKVMEECKTGQKGDTFFCKDPKCEK